MGFSLIVAGAILAVALLFSLTIVANAYFSTEADVRQSWDLRERRAAEERQSAIAVTAVAFNGTATAIDVATSGSVTLDAAAVELFLGGGYQVHGDVSRAVEGRASDVWVPQSVLRLTVPANGTPTDALVIADGIRAYWVS